MSDKSREIAVTFDEADVDMEALRDARRAAFGSLARRGVNDLNTVDADTWDIFCFIVKLHYENRLAARNHTYGTFNWRLVWKNGEHEEIIG